MDLKAFVRGERIELPGRGLGGMIETSPKKPVIAAVEGSLWLVVLKLR